MNNNRQNIQILSIFAIIITAFLGSAMLFSYLNTDSIKQSVEKETGIASVVLSSAIAAGIEDEPIAAQSDAQPAAEPGASESDLSRRLSELMTETITFANSEVGENIDVWVVDSSDNILYENISEGGKALRELLTEKEWEEPLSTGREEKTKEGESGLMWIGEQSLFMFSQQLVVVRPVIEGQIYLVLCNEGKSVHAMQRRQFSLFAWLEAILMVAMIIILANTLFSYRKQIIRLATTDELTGLANRKSFNEAYREYINNTVRSAQENFAVFLIDIDYFKQINDTYGHASGDLALRTLAGHIGRMAERCGGFAGRWGGDEFIGVLPVPEAEAVKMIDQLCADVRADHMDGNFGITISAGAAEAERAQSPELAHLTELADLALYVSKENGRNRATFYSKEMENAAEMTAKAEAVQKESPQPAEGAETEKKPAAAAAQTAAEPTGAPGAVKRTTFRNRLEDFIRYKMVKSILLGVKWMAPFVAGGGILIGLAFLFDACSVDLESLSVAERTQLGSITPLAASLKSTGDNTFNFMLPVFAGFMAYGLAGESAFLTGFVGGFMTIQSNAGFIGAMIAGLMAGLIASENNEFVGRMPKVVQKAAPIIIFPVVNLLLMYVIASLLITPVATFVGNGFSQMLHDLSSLNYNLSCAIAGGMMAVDMGGILNKVAYNYGVNGLTTGGTGFMASVMAGGMVPPIGIVISMFLFKNEYSTSERDRAASTLFMGLSFITEGALPFVFSDALRVIPSCIVGSALAGGLSALYGCELPAPHGGIFVLPLMTKPLFYILAVAAGSLVTALLLGWLKKEHNEHSQTLEP